MSQLTTVVRVELSRSDLAGMQIRLGLQHRSTLIGWLAIAAFVGVTIVAGSGLPNSTRNWMAFALSVAGGATAAIAIAFIWSTITILLMSSKKAGVLGVHLYTVTEAGLLEQTVANETLIKWGGVNELRRTQREILIGAAPGLYHVIPRRAFSDNAAFDSFWAAIQRLRSGDT